MWTSLVQALIVLLANRAGSSVVKTTHGPIEGTTLTLFTGKKVDAFLGVPYAAPPTGQNRFAPPQPLAPWNNILEVKKLPFTCPQVQTEVIKKTMWYYSDFPESEDCLHLNVWKPQEVTEKMPIMIWIHGGGYIGGSSNMPVYNASILASENNVIVASLNYRLGLFGFLYLNNSEVPGNAALQDHIQAIRWIRDNAEAFGGDPERITLFGQSAGAICSNAYLIDRNVSNLFRNVIMESGTLNSALITLSTSDAYQGSLHMSEQVHCPVEDTYEMLACLRSKPALELQKTIPGMLTKGRVTYGPVRNGIEVPLDTSDLAKYVPGHERKSIMIGGLPMEMAFISQEVFPDKPLTDDLTVTPEEMANTIKGAYQIHDDRLQSVILHEYKTYDGKQNSSNLRLELFTALSDVASLCPEAAFSKQWVSESNHVYNYYFTHRPSQPLKYPIPEWVGPIHGDEIPFVLGTALDPQKGYTDYEKKLSKRMMRYWSNFAKTGDPNSGSPHTYWPPLTSGDNFNHLEFQQMEIESKKVFPAARRCDFWSQVYPKLLSIQQQLDKKTS